jgi:hypothetical protein
VRCYFGAATSSHGKQKPQGALRVLLPAQWPDGRERQGWPVARRFRPVGEPSCLWSSWGGSRPSRSGTIATPVSVAVIPIPEAGAHVQFQRNVTIEQKIKVTESRSHGATVIALWLPPNADGFQKIALLAAASR